MAERHRLNLSIQRDAFGAALVSKVTLARAVL
jgi:hypothetical protein